MMMTKNTQTFIYAEIQKLKDLLAKIQEDENLMQTLEEIALSSAKALEQGKKILWMGNGGSAADSQHLAGELVVRLKSHRRALASIALTTDSSILTSISNDYEFEQVFSRQVEALGQPGDVLVGISTSGKSPNILRGFAEAREKQMLTVGFTGVGSAEMTARCDYILCVPSVETAKIQECHIMLGHILCGLIEKILFE